MEKRALYFLKNLQEYCINMEEKKKTDIRMFYKVRNKDIENREWGSKFLDAFFLSLNRFWGHRDGLLLFFSTTLFPSLSRRERSVRPDQHRKEKGDQKLTVGLWGIVVFLCLMSG